MQDGLGLVFEKQGNTGAAAYNQPVLGIGQNPLDRIALQTKEQVDILGAQQLEEQKQKDKLNQQALEIGGSGWEIDNDRQLGAYLKAYKTGVTDLMAKGVKPTDYTNPESKKYWEMKQGWENLKNNSLAQKEQFKKAYDIVIGDLNSPNPQFEHEPTFAKMREWQNLPIEERMKVPIESLLVKKQAPFDMYAPIKDIDISKGFVGKNGYETPETASSSTKLNEKNLKEVIKLESYNPKNDAHYQQGKALGYWDTRDEYAQVQYDKKKLEFTPDNTYEKKAPKGKTLIDISNGNSQDLITKLGAGQQKMVVPLYNLDGKQTDKSGSSTIDNVTQLNNINSTVNWGSAIDATTGKSFEDTGSFDFKSGAMAIPLVRKGTNRIIATDGGYFKYKDSKGNTQTITGDKATIESELVKRGLAEYKPMLFGKAYTKDEAGKEATKDVWIPADAAIHGAGDSNKALSEGEYAYEVYKKRAADMNKTTQASLKAGQNKPVSRAAIKSLVGKKGYEGYTEKELIDYYTSQGYTIQ